MIKEQYVKLIEYYTPNKEFIELYTPNEEMSKPDILNIYYSILQIINDCYNFIIKNELDKFISLKNKTDGCYLVLNVKKNNSLQIIKEQYDKLIKEYTPNNALKTVSSKNILILYDSIRKNITDCYKFVIKILYK